jgi:enoyl-CoA hydratase/carnithine racemase
VIGATLDGAGVLRIELRRPEKRNALCRTMYVALAEALRDAAARDEVRAVLLCSAGEVFCAGNDLAEFATDWPQPPEGPVLRFLETLHDLDKPVIAAIQGGAVGIGATMLLHCDIVLAAPDAFLQFPFVDLGITVEGAGSLLLPLRLGHLRAMEILLTCRRVQAEEAVALGLVTRISTARLPAEEAMDLARAVAAKPASAVRATKRLLRHGARGEVHRRFAEEIDRIGALILEQRTAPRDGG